MDILKHFLLAVALVFLLTGGAGIMLSVITRHNQEMVVPDFRNMSPAEAEKIASRAGVRLVVKDSVYIRGIRKGVIFEQFPKAGSNVKKGRKIELTTNTLEEKRIPMPALVGFSLRQARAELIRNGLRLGRMSFVPDIATNMVLRQTFNGYDITPGDPITSGSNVDLVVGVDDMADNMTQVPDLSGKPYMRAIDLIQDNFLNVGKIHFDSSVRTWSDTLNAFVYSQYPRAGSGFLVQGTDVSISLSVNDGKRTF